ALQVVKEMGFKRTLILTHRPVVDSGWYEDFGKIFYDIPTYRYGSKNVGDDHSSLERHANGGGSYVYFASMQDLRGSQTVGGKFDKNDKVFSTPWDFIIVDEAHEGTQTELGKNVMTELIKPTTKVLRLSGTPFNLLDNYKEGDIYTWDYVMEQRAKAAWDQTHPGDPNPYAGLPTMNIFTYDLGRLLHDFIDEDVAFNFREFFRVKEDGTFIHADDVRAFLNLLTKEDADSCYPFANENYRNIFRHTLWMLPGVKAAKAMKELMAEHTVFQHFTVVNVAGDGDEESDDALEAVRNAIGTNSDQTRTITLSCGRLTTGVSVKEWTGVLMLSGSFHTAASSYMQTIFRVQTPATINGRMKEQAYVFDFAPDRTLQVLASVPRMSAKAGKTTDGQRREMGEFLNFCPVIAISGSKMETLNVNRMLEQLKKAYVERVVRNGFEDGALYNDELMRLNEVDVKDFANLKKIIGTTKAMGNSGQIDINDQGLTDEQYEEKTKLEKKPKKELTEEERKRLEELKKKKKVKQDAISILRGISIRMPLMIYGADVDNEDTQLTIDNFTSLIDPQSWDEFMPQGVTKQHFNHFKKYYDPDIFSAAAKRIRAMARAADRLSVEQRIQRITSIFSSFRNPDKETVLTPWRVVNMHLGDTLGGYNFFNDNYAATIDEPRFIDHGKPTDDVFRSDAHILEINSKSGLYPLYMAYGIYRARVKESMFAIETVDAEQRLWDKTVAENIFVVCKTPMAKAITQRTLLGFRTGKTNMWAPDDLINKIKNQPDLFIKKVKNLIGKKVKINAIVGNPPYQVMDGGGTGSSAQAIYNKFVEVGKCLNPNYLTMIIPSRWMTGGKGLDKFREAMLADTHIRLLHDYLDSHECFPTVAIEGGVCYFRWDKDCIDKCKFISHSNGVVNVTERYLSENSSGIVIRDAGSLSILEKTKSEDNFSKLVSPRNLFKVEIEKLREQEKENGIKVFGRYNRGRGNQFLDNYITKDIRAERFLGKWKVFVSKADGAAGQLGNPIPARIIGKAELGDPFTICTETFLAVGPFNSRQETVNVMKYFTTKFFRFLVGVR
ncbi:MAG: Eco57I restriction-modification methylase domain-containing protein, partial [Sodaliphilus sp.]|nr:Eco57I restriction-modification methylase domain-containing protein [Sodaliphilus sp.]